MWRHLPNVKRSVHCKECQALYQTAKKTSKSIHNWRRYATSKSYEIVEDMRFGIWCSTMAPPDATRKKLQYGCKTTVPQVHNSHKDILKNLLPVGLLVWYGIIVFNVPLDTVQVISETGALSSDVHLPFSNGRPAT